MPSRPVVAIAVVGAAVLAASAALAQPKSHATPHQPVAPLHAQACAGCHGQNGAGQGGTPILAGYDPAAFVRVWGEFRNNQRPTATIMNRIARGYSDDEVAALAAYFASVKR